MRLNRTAFFSAYKRVFEPLRQSQVDALNSLLDYIEADPHMRDVRWVSYALATIRHETDRTYEPIQEYGGYRYFESRYGYKTKKGKELGNDTAGEGAAYSGKGLVQLTGKSNFERAEEDLRREYPDVVARFEQRTGKKFDLTIGDDSNDADDVNNAKDPEIAYCILSFGMRHGRFTGRKLSHYFNDNLNDPVRARKIINGMDKAQTIAAYHRKFEGIVKAATEAPPQDEIVEIINEVEKAPEPPVVTSQIPESNPPQLNTTATETVKREKPGWWARVIGFLGFGASGYKLTDMDWKSYFTKANEQGLGVGEILTLLFIVVGILGLGGMGLWFWNQSAQRAHERNLAKLKMAGDRTLNTVEFVGKKGN